MDDVTKDPTPEQEYEAPHAEDVTTHDAPSITAAGETVQDGAGV